MKLKNYTLKLFFITLLIAPCDFAWSYTSGEVTAINKSPKALLMGDAYTAIADDEYTLYYNPAALGRHNGLSIHFVNPEIGVTNVLADMDKFKDFPSSDPAAIADRILGFPLYIRLAGTPGIKMGQFGFSMMASATANLELRNAIYPSLDVDYRLDRGFILGYAFSLGAGKRKKSKRSKGGGGSSGGSKASIGFALKNFNRQGIFANFDLFGLNLMNKLSKASGGFHEIRKSLGYSYGRGWGGDIGAEYSYSTSISQLTFAIAVKDIADTRFILTEGEREIPKQKMAVNTGVAWTQDFFILDYTLSADFGPLNQSLPLGRTAHFGFEVGLPIVSALFGWNGGYISYGLGIDLWVLKLYAGFYGIEIGHEFKQEEGKRGTVYVSILDFSFDP